MRLFLSQKWQCVEDPTGKLRLYKCKGMASLYAPRMQALMARGASPLSTASTSNSCNCASAAFKTPVVKRKRLLTKKSEFPSSHSCVTLFRGLFIDFDLSQTQKKKIKTFCGLFSNVAAVALQSLARRAIYLRLKLPPFEVFMEWGVCVCVCCHQVVNQGREKSLKGSRIVPFFRS